MSANPPEGATERLHRLCEERIAFFLRRFDEQGLLLGSAVEFETFFENARGRHVHVDAPLLRQELQKMNCFVQRVALDFGHPPVKRPWIPYQTPYTGNLSTVKDYPAEHISLLAVYATGYSHVVKPFIARQYEVELWYNIYKNMPLETQISRMNNFLKGILYLPGELDYLGETMGYAWSNSVPQRHMHTLGYMTAPSMHVNASLIDKEKCQNIMGDDKGEPTALATRCMKAMCLLDREGSALFLDSPDAFRRIQKGYSAPRFIDYRLKKDGDAAICYRNKKDIPDYTHIEHRAPGATADPYLAMVITLAGMYMGTRERQLDHWLKHSAYREDKRFPADLAEAQARLEKSDLMQQLLGEELYQAVCERGRARMARYEEQCPPHHAERLTTKRRLSHHGRA